MNASLPSPVSGLAERWRGVRLRPFGLEPGDLEVDFSGERLALVSGILARCASRPGGERFDAEELDELRLGARIEGLLRLAILADAGARGAGEGDEDEVEVERLLRCVGCDATVGINLPLRALADLQRAVAAIEVIEAPTRDGGRVKLRLPRASDLRAWGRGDAAPGDEALLARLRVGDAAIASADLPAIEAALAAADPLVDFTIDLTCPECHAQQEAHADLEELALARLAREQAALLDAIHRLARAYHWSEEAIVRLPAWRRRAYLDRLAREEAR